MNLEKNTFPDEFYEDLDEDLQYDDASECTVELEYTTQQ
tara:strand:+ start:900 stop:1016 length:117 start_codon:yes stop_codon:yes gene_type:complete